MIEERGTAESGGDGHAVPAHRQTVYRLLPRTRKNWRLLEQVLEDQRQLYNAALQERNDAWRLAGRSISYVDQTKALTVCRRDLPEMAAMPVAIQRGTLRRVDEAFKGFFRRARVRTGAVGYPRFKSRRRFDSITVVSGVKLEAGPRGTSGGRLRLPGLGWLTIRRRGDNPHAQGRPVSAVLKREAGRWYAIVCFRVPAAPRNTPGGSADNGVALGIDMNAGQIAASDGRLFHAPDTRRLEARAKRLSRKLARQRRGSRRRERTRRRLAKTRRRMTGMRRNWRHQVTRRIADAADTVCVEALHVRGMTRSARGTVAEPGSRVRQKAGLNRVILATGWAEMRRMLSYKAGRLVAVDPAWTSRTCHACGHVDAGSRRTRSEFQCTACGHADHADANAARNIRRQGLALLHGEVAGLPGRRTVNTQERLAA